MVSSAISGSPSSTLSQVAPQTTPPPPLPALPPASRAPLTSTSPSVFAPSASDSSTLSDPAEDRFVTSSLSDERACRSLASYPPFLLNVPTAKELFARRVFTSAVRTVALHLASGYLCAWRPGGGRSRRVLLATTLSDTLHYFTKQETNT